MIDFAFAMAGEAHRLSHFRGRPLVLILMRTSEISSQIYMQQVKAAFAGPVGDTRFLVLTIEPREAPFVEAYAEFEDLPFDIGVAEPALRNGQTMLGLVPGIPCTYVFDAHGHLKSAAPGILKSSEIVDAIKALNRRHF